MTDLFGRLMLVAAVLAMLAAAARTALGGPVLREAAAAADETTPAAAIERAVVERLGGHVEVEVLALDTAVAPARALHALPEPGGRAGAPARFVLMVGRVRRGIAVASVKVRGPFARAARTIARRETITADAVDVVTGELVAVGFQRLPGPDEVLGLVARRDIAAGEPLTQAAVQLPPLVKPGDEVVLTVVAGAVRITAKAIAASSGYEGDVIRVTPEGGRPLKARISGPGTVEVNE
jgi:flagella basal body P-ring formation protein FlgA